MGLLVLLKVQDCGPLMGCNPRDPIQKLRDRHGLLGDVAGLAAGHAVVRSISLSYIQAVHAVVAKTVLVLDGLHAIGGTTVVTWQADENFKPMTA
jgi:hypothetical protein